MELGPVFHHSPDALQNVRPNFQNHEVRLGAILIRYMVFAGAPEAKA
jgi:hypothetical protein